MPELLANEPELPACLIYLWHWFLRLSNRRGGGFGPAPLTHSNLRDFFELSGVWPTPWEIEQIEALDDLYLKILGEEEDKKAKQDNSQKEDG